MTDNEIIKVLECCGKPVSENCKECPLCSQDCLDIDPCELALDLINRQQAVIERLKEGLASKNLEYSLLERERAEDISGFVYDLKFARAEAIKEFAERLKEEINIRPTHSNEQNKYVCFLIDNLVKESEGNQ